MKDAITALFGSQQTAKLDTIDTVLQNQEKKFDVRLTGFISRPMSTPGVGNGRSSSGIESLAPTLCSSLEFV